MLKSIPYISSSGRAEQNTCAHEKDSAKAPVFLNIENGGWNGPRIFYEYHASFLHSLWNFILDRYLVEFWFLFTVNIIDLKKKVLRNVSLWLVIWSTFENARRCLLQTHTLVFWTSLGSNRCQSIQKYRTTQKLDCPFPNRNGALRECLRTTIKSMLGIWFSSFF